MAMPNQTENPSERMLRKIAEANTMCYHAQCHFRNASSLAADGPYHRGQKNKPLINAVREARLGSDKLQTSFALLRQDELLVRKHPVLVTQEGSIPTEDLREIDLRSNALFATNNNNNNTADRASDRELLQHCSSILRFVHRCEEISAHQRKFLESVEAQIQAENPPVVQQVHHHHHYNHYIYHHHQKQHQYDMPDPENHNVPLDASALTPLDRIISNSNPKQPIYQDFVEQQRRDFDPPPSPIARRHTRLANPNLKQPAHQDVVEQQRYDFDPPPSPIPRRRTSRLASPHPRPDEEFDPLPFDQAVDLSSLGEENLTSIANSDEEFEPLPIDKAMDLSLEELDLKPIKTMMSSAVSSSPHTTQNEMLTHSNRQDYKPEFKKDANATSISPNTTATRKSFASQSTAASPAAAVGDKKQPKIRRTRSGGLLEKRRRRPQKRSPKTKSKKDMKKPPATEKHPDEMWKLAVGGRMDFMQKDVGYTPKARRQSTHSESDVGLDKNEDTDSDDSRGHFAFDDFPLGLPDFSRRSHSC